MIPCAVLHLLAKLAKPMYTVSSTSAAGPSRSSRLADSSSVTVGGVFVMASRREVVRRSVHGMTEDPFVAHRSLLFTVAYELQLPGHRCPVPSSGWVAVHPFPHDDARHPATSVQGGNHCRNRESQTAQSLQQVQLPVQRRLSAPAESCDQSPTLIADDLHHLVAVAATQPPDDPQPAPGPKCLSYPAMLIG